MALFKNYKFILGLVGLITLEAVLIIVLLPARSKTGGSSAEGEHAASESEHSESELHEFKLGADMKVHNETEPGSPLRIEFDAFATVSAEDHAAFEHLYKAKEQRIREAIQTVMRTASVEEIKDEKQTAIKQKIHEAVTKVLGSDKKYIKGVILPKFWHSEL